jgi:hypothetical protein
MQAGPRAFALAYIPADAPSRRLAARNRLPHSSSPRCAYGNGRPGNPVVTARLTVARKASNDDAPDGSI